MSSAFLILGTAAGLEGSGVDPETASDRRLILDSTAASTITSDIDGVELWEDKDDSGRNTEQDTVADRPDEVTDGIQGDSTDRLTSVDGFTWGDILDADGFTILMLMKTPTVFTTNNTGEPFSNQMMMSDLLGGALGFSYTRSAGTIGMVVANDSAEFKTAERPDIETDTWYRIAMRLRAGNIGILIDDETSFTETDLEGSVFAAALARTVVVLEDQGGAFPSLGILNILIVFNVGKTDAEVVDFFKFWAPRVPS